MKNLGFLKKMILVFAVSVVMWVVMIVTFAHLV